MIQRIKTSSVTSENLSRIQNKYHFSTKASILRICIALSLKSAENPLSYIANCDFRTGFELSINTLFGEYELYFQSLIKFHANKNLDDEEYLEYVVAHIEHGMTILFSDFATTNSLKELLQKIS